jgi:hypothetical protein
MFKQKSLNSHESTRSRLTFALYCICCMYETSTSYDTCHYLKCTRPQQRKWTCVLLRNVWMFSICFPTNALRDAVYIIYKNCYMLCILYHEVYLLENISIVEMCTVWVTKNLNVLSMIMIYSFQGINYRICTHCRQSVPNYLVMFHECKKRLRDRVVPYRASSLKIPWHL